MIAKLFISVLAVSDIGVPYTHFYDTDMPAEICQLVSQQLFNGVTDTQLNGHKVQIRVRSRCVPMASAPLPPPSASIPPEVLDMMNMFMRGIMSNITRGD